MKKYCIKELNLNNHYSFSKKFIFYNSKLHMKIQICVDSVFKINLMKVINDELVQ